MTSPAVHVTGGVDTHADIHVAVVIDSNLGHVIGTGAFDADPSGYMELLAWMRDHGELDKVGVEGTGTYGAGLTRHLLAEQIEVVEVDRPDRKARRRHGKSDPVDAEAAARAALAGTATAAPKTRDGLVEAIRALEVVYKSAVKDRTRAINQFHSLVVTAPDEIREKLRELSKDDQIARARRFAHRDGLDPVVAEIRYALRELARRIADLDEQTERLEQRLRPLVAEAAPALLGVDGVGIHIAADLLTTLGDNPERLGSESAFAHLCGVAPVPASSGKTQRHRLNRSGDRRANHALWRIVMVRMTYDPRTRDYVERRTAEGKTKREIMRCLKRYVAREVYRLIVNPPDVVTGPALRRLREETGLGLRAVAEALDTHAIRISEIERQLVFNNDLARRAHDHITEHARLTEAA